MQNSSALKLKVEDLGISPVDDSHRKIPAAKYIANIEAFIDSNNPMLVEGLFRQLLLKYRMMEKSLLNQLESRRAKIVEISQATDAICLLRDQADKAKNGEDGTLRTHLELADTVYTEARIPTTNTVCLWLGANVVMEYSLDEAESLLEKNLKSANKSVKIGEEDIEWVRNQITMSEVNVARVHNYAVRMREKSIAT